MAMTMKTTDYIYCADCEEYVDLWQYSDIEAAGHAGCRWRHVAEEELEECIHDCRDFGCFQQEEPELADMAG